MASAAVAHPSEAVQPISRDVESDSVSVQLEVQMLTGRTIVPNSVFLASAPLASVKEAVHENTGIPVRHQSLIWQDIVLGHDVPLGDLSLPSAGAVLVLVVSLPPEDQISRARESMQQACAALDVLDCRSLSELKNMVRPPAGVAQVLQCVMQLRAGIDPAIAVDSQGRVKDDSWAACCKMIKNPKKFVAGLQDFKTVIENGSLPTGNVRAACRIRDATDFSLVQMRMTSLAAARLVTWVLNIIQYHQVCEAIRAEFEGFDIMTEIREQMKL